MIYYGVLWRETSYQQLYFGNEECVRSGQELEQSRYSIKVQVVAILETMSTRVSEGTKWRRMKVEWSIILKIIEYNEISENKHELDDVMIDYQEN